MKPIEQPTNEKTVAQSTISQFPGHKRSMAAENNASVPLVIEEIPEAQNRPNALRVGCMRFQEWLAPNTVTEDGSSRIVTLDIMRGIGIFCMMIMHEAGKFENNIADGIEDLKNQSGINKVIIAVIGGLMLIFDNFKSFFALISASTMAYLFFNKCETLKYTQACKVQFFMLFQSCAMSLLWFFFDQLEPILQPDDGQIEIKFPLHAFFTAFSQTPMFFGCAIVLSTVYCILCYWIIVVPYNEIRKHFEFVPMKCCFWFLALLSYLFSWLIHFVFTDVNQKMNQSLIDHMLQYPTGNPVTQQLKARQECVVTYVNPMTGGALKYGLNYWVYYYVLHIISGRFMMLIPFIAYTLMGFAFGFLMVAFQYEKQECRNAANEMRKSMYLKRRTLYFVCMICSCVVSLMFYFLVGLQTKQHLRQGTRIEHFRMSSFVDTGNLWKCMFPEYSAYMIILEQCLFVFCLFAFEARTKEAAKRLTQKTLFLRRYSTLSFSIFLFQSFFSLITLTIWGLQANYKYNELTGGVERGPKYVCTPMEAILYLAFYVVLGHFVMIAMEKCGDVFTVDWVFSRARHLLTPGKGEFKPLSNQHLKVKPINIFGKDEIE